MAIPVSQAHDVLLGYLLRRYPELIDQWQPLETVAEGLVPFFVAHKSPGFVFNPHPPPVPRAFVRAAESLQRRSYVEFDHENGRIKLTSLGAIVAVLHDLPEELLSSIELARTNGSIADAQHA